jgi:hypothetical protein
VLQHCQSVVDRLVYGLSGEDANDPTHGHKLWGD